MRYCFDGFGGLGYSVTAAVAGVALADAGAAAVSCGGWVPRPQPIITSVVMTSHRDTETRRPKNVLRVLRVSVARDPKVIFNAPVSTSVTTLSGKVDVHGADDDRADHDVLDVRGNL